MTSSECIRHYGCHSYALFVFPSAVFGSKGLKQRPAGFAQAKVISVSRVVVGEGCFGSGPTTTSFSFWNPAVLSQCDHELCCVR